MKKILIASNMVLLIIVFFQACHWTKSNSSTGPGRPHTFCEDSACYGNAGAELSGMINYELAKQMADSYGNDDGKKFIWNGATNTHADDSKNIWFDLKKIKNFIGFIESTLCKNGCPVNDTYGIRIYFAKYPDAKTMKLFPALRDVPLEYANHHTVFMVPTYFDATTHHNIDFDPQNSRAGCKLIPYSPSNIKGVIYAPFYKAGTAESSEQNHGNIKPPPAGGNFPTVE